MEIQDIVKKAEQIEKDVDIIIEWRLLETIKDIAKKIQNDPEHCDIEQLFKAEQEMLEAKEKIKDAHVKLINMPIPKN